MATMLQQHLHLIAAQEGLSLPWFSDEELRTNKLKKDRMVLLGSRSPKISKFLLKLGMSPKSVSLLFGGCSSTSTSRVTGEAEDCLDQGNSVFFVSCQATDPRAAWEGSDHNCMINKDLDEIGTNLFLWVSGDRMSINGKGFKARAKVRVVFEDRLCDEIWGLYVDTPYGDRSLLRPIDLCRWAYSHFGKPVRVVFAPAWGGDEVRLRFPVHVPSGISGYQDSLCGVSLCEVYTSDAFAKSSIMKRAYTARTRIAGVYMNTLSDVRFSQSFGLSAPLLELSPTRSVKFLLHKRWLKSLSRVIGKYVVPSGAITSSDIDEYTPEGTTLYLYLEGKLVCLQDKEEGRVSIKARHYDLKNSRIGDVIFSITVYK